jgi:hypothetical protein
MIFKTASTYCALILLSCFFTNAYAQPGTAATEGIKLFFEKVYVHTDRTYYASGDDIWFKAYLVSGQSNEPINTSKNLYVQLVDPNANIVAERVIRVDHAMGVGDFRLGDSIAGGTYRLRAYTNWMRNFGTHFIFEKELQVASLTAGTPLHKSISTSTMPANKIQFLPEGGTMIEDVPTIISFRAEDGNGKGIDANGSIVTMKGEAVATFKTSHMGMGSFSFTPKAGTQYKAMVQYKNSKAVDASFPVALPEGFVMNIITSDPAKATVNITANNVTAAKHASGQLTIVARHAGKNYFKQQVSLKDGKASLDIPSKNLPAGIAYITLYDESMHPNCERLVYVESSTPYLVKFSADKSTYQTKEKVTVNISITDNQDIPVDASLSLAAVDAAMEPLQSTNILSNLLLESELKGKIENASAYFDKTNQQRHEQLDLLLRTQGWRSFLWRQLADTNIRISYLPEQGITISGKALKPYTDKPVPDINITLIASQAKGDKIYTTKTRPDGSYFLDGLPLYGTQTIKLNAKSDKGKDNAFIVMDTLFNNRIAVSKTNNSSTDTSVALQRFTQEAAKRFSINKTNQWYTVLPSVTVTNKRKALVLRDGIPLMNYGPNYDFQISAKDLQYKTLGDFLVQKVPGATHDVETDGVNIVANGKPVRPRIIVDKREDVFERLDFYKISMDNINSVSVLHMLGHPSFERTESDNGRIGLGAEMKDVFVIQLSLKPGAYNQDVSKISTEINGYYEARVFYAPNYSSADKSKADARTTIHWEPLIKTDENGKATVTFYNADNKGPVRINVQGVSSTGTPIVESVQYEVK